MWTIKRWLKIKISFQVVRFNSIHCHTQDKEQNSRGTRKMVRNLKQVNCFTFKYLYVSHSLTTTTKLIAFFG